MRQPVTIEQMERIAPAIFATEPAASTSDQYRFVPTTEILYGLMDNGFVPVQARQNRTLKEGAEQHAKHMIRFQHEDFMKDISEVGDEIPELVLYNSHNGKSSYQLMMGIFRLICSNGMVVMSESINKTRVLHRGPEQMVGDVIEASFEVVKEAPKVMAQIEEWKAIEFNEEEKTDYATIAFALRKSKLEVPTSQLLSHSRMADKGDDVWRTMNRVQENIIRGKIRGETGQTDWYGRPKTRRVSAIKSVEADTKFNKELWLMTEKAVLLKKMGKGLKSLLPTILATDTIN